MCSPRPSASRLRRHSAGFTLIELMIGVVIGLLASLAVTHVLVNSEGQKRSTTSGSDAQVNGALALNTLQRALQPAGYGFASVPAVVGCTVTATFNSNPVTATVPDFPGYLAPVVITDGATGAPDTVRVLASGKGSFAIPLRVVAVGYSDSSGFKLPVGSVRGIAAGDLIVASMTSTAAPSVPCEVFQVSSNPGSTPEVTRSAGAWNGGALTNGYATGAVLVNMGAPSDLTYSIVNNSLMVRALAIGSDASSTPSYTTTELYPNIVQLQALYGKDSDGNGSVDTWDACLVRIAGVCSTAPADNTAWRQVIAVRIAVVARSTQYEKDNVTFADTAGTGYDLNWDVGNAGTVTDSATCGASKCLAIKLSNLADWQHYRYRLFETIVPLRNMLWNS
jgi:type IV pilus assembly protein PilW